MDLVARYNAPTCLQCVCGKNVLTGWQDGPCIEPFAVGTAELQWHCTDCGRTDFYKLQLRQAPVKPSGYMDGFMYRRLLELAKEPYQPLSGPSVPRGKMLSLQAALDLIQKEFS